MRGRRWSGALGLAVMVGSTTAVARHPNRAPVPAGFRATSIAVASPSTWFALGGADCGQRNCRTLVARSDDSGQSWRLVNSPGAVSVEVAPGPDFTASRIAFLNPSVGWVYGGGLWSTHDGGAHWHRVPIPDMVSGIAVVGTTVYALGEGCNTAGQMCMWGEVFESPVGRDSFRPVTGLPQFGTGGGGLYGSLTQVGRGGYLFVEAFGGRPFVAFYRNSGSGWLRVRSPCGLGFAVLGGSAPEDPIAVCYVFRNRAAAVRVFGSHSGGSTWGRLADPPPVGEPTSVAVTSGGAAFLGGSNAVLAVMRDGGHSWLRLDELGGAGWSQVAFVSGTTVLALPYVRARATHVIVTTDGGRTWRREPFHRLRRNAE